MIVFSGDDDSIQRHCSAYSEVLCICSADSYGVSLGKKRGLTRQMEVKGEKSGKDRPTMRVEMRCDGNAGQRAPGSDVCRFPRFSHRVGSLQPLSV